MPRRAPNLESVAAAIYSRDNSVPEQPPVDRNPAVAAVARAAIRQRISYGRVGNPQVYEQRQSLPSSPTSVSREIEED